MISDHNLLKILLNKSFVNNDESFQVILNILKY
jgi:hypothetical protein